LILPLAIQPILQRVFSYSPDYATVQTLRKGIGINRTAKLVGLSNGTVRRLKDELVGRSFGVTA
jgi:hypothetical protein